jgi:hypothetical protein
MITDACLRLSAGRSFKARALKPLTEALKEPNS